MCSDLASKAINPPENRLDILESHENTLSSTCRLVNPTIPIYFEPIGDLNQLDFPDSFSLPMRSLDISRRFPAFRARRGRICLRAGNPRGMLGREALTVSGDGVRDEARGIRAGRSLRIHSRPLLPASKNSGAAARRPARIWYRGGADSRRPAPFRPARRSPPHA